MRGLTLCVLCGMLWVRGRPGVPGAQPPVADDVAPDEKPLPPPSVGVWMT